MCVCVCVCVCEREREREKRERERERGARDTCIYHDLQGKTSTVTMVEMGSKGLPNMPGFQGLSKLMYDPGMACCYASINSN